MGLQPMDEDKAVDLLIDREIPFTNSVIPKLVNAFPAFSNRWRKHVAEWGGEPAGSYNDISQFVHFVIDELYEVGNLDETNRVFRLLEDFLVEADQETRDLIALGFFETLQCVASWRPYGSKAFLPMLGSQSKRVWSEIEAMWIGKSSLMEVIESERQGL